MLYQLSYPAKLHNSTIFQCSYSCELQTKYTKGNKCKIYIEIMKYAIYAKSAQLNFVFCLDFEFFHHFSPSRIAQICLLLIGIKVAFDQCVEFFFIQQAPSEQRKTAQKGLIGLVS